jgi:hypothetical protein
MLEAAVLVVVAVAALVVGAVLAELRQRVRVEHLILRSPMIPT